jgi:hypothetical protein
MVTLEEVKEIAITLTDGILTIRQEYKTPIEIPIMYVPILLQLIQKECDTDKKEREASNGRS